jgi:predicted enzyme related to lactoylglutathione lyase
MIRGIGVAYIHSADRAKLAAWYAQKLDIPIAAEYPGWAEMQVESGSRFGIDQTNFPRSAVEKQPVILSFLVDDIHAAVKELASRGVRFVPSPETTVFDVGPSLVATFVDADGNWCQIHQTKQQ